MLRQHFPLSIITKWDRSAWKSSWRNPKIQMVVCFKWRSIKLYMLLYSIKITYYMNISIFIHNFHIFPYTTRMLKYGRRNYRAKSLLLHWSAGGKSEIPQLNGSVFQASIFWVCQLFCLKTSVLGPSVYRVVLHIKCGTGNPVSWFYQMILRFFTVLPKSLLNKQTFFFVLYFTDDKYCYSYMLRYNLAYCLALGTAFIVALLSRF